MFVRLIVCLFLGFCFSLPVLNWAQSASTGVTSPPNTIVIKNHQFFPDELTVTANKKLQITVDNQDSSAEEFESFDLDREQVVEGNGKITVFIGPLKPGRYNYWADYHMGSKGVIVAQ